MLCYARLAFFSLLFFNSNAVHYNKQYNNLSGVNKKPPSKASGSKHAMRKQACYSLLSVERGMGVNFYSEAVGCYFTSQMSFVSSNSVKL